MEKKAVIYSDVDGTLIFHNDFHRIQEKGRNPDETVSVYDPKTRRHYTALDVSTRLYGSYMDQGTQALGLALQEHCTMVAVTGGRRTTLEARKHALTFLDAAILESGGVILYGRDEDGKYMEDKEWKGMLEPERKELRKFQKFLIGTEWALDYEGRTSSIRIRREDNLERADEFEELPGYVKNALPPELEVTKNMGHLDIILASAGKGNAATYLTDRLGYSQRQSVGIGDDDNDLDLLYGTGVKLVLGSSSPLVIKVAKSQYWYISEGHHFEGINEIFKHLLRLFTKE